MECPAKVCERVEDDGRNLCKAWSAQQRCVREKDDWRNLCKVWSAQQRCVREKRTMGETYARHGVVSERRCIRGRRGWGRNIILPGDYFSLLILDSSV